MTAGLSEINGQAVMAYNTQNGHPWHTLGNPVPHAMTIDEALNFIGLLDEEITMVDLFDAEGVQARNLQAIKSNKFDGHMGYASPGYSVMEPRELMEIAFEVIGLSGAALDTIGRIGEFGQRFFAYLRQENLIIDPNGIADEIEKGFVVATSFDGMMKNIINPSKIRVVCNNTLELSIRNLTGGIAVLHTATAEARIRQAAEALDYQGAQEKAFVAEIEKMLQLPAGPALNVLAKEFWPIDDDTKDRVRTRRENELGLMHELYAKEKEKVGPNAYAVWNAFIEKEDHFLTVKRMPNQELSEDEVKAFRAVFPGNVMNDKLKAGRLILA